MRRSASRSLLILATIACGGGDGSPVQPGGGSPPPPPAPVATVAIAPDTATLVRAQGRTLTVTLRDAAGNVLTGRAVAWSSSAQTVATVNTDGAVTAVAPGVSRIAASSEGKDGTATITVAEGGMVGTDGADIATTDSTVRVSIPAGAVSSAQAVTIARLASPPTHPRLVAATTVTIAPTAALARAATLRLAYRGATLANGADSSRLRLHRHDGNAWVEVAGGSVNVTTREVSGGTSALGTFGVIELPPLPIATIALARDTATLVAAQTLQLLATARDSGGAALANRSITWATGNGAVASVTAQGLVTAHAPGTATITASAEGKSREATITVQEGGFVNTSGGTIATVDGRARVTFPAGALAQAQAITIQPIANPVAHPRLVPGTAFEFGPSQAFAQPVTMTLRYSPGAIPGGAAANSLRLHRLESGAWVEVPGSSVDVAASTVTGPTSSFSSYAVLAGIPAQAVTITWNGGNTPVCSLPAPASCGLQFGGWKVPDGVYQVTAELWGAAGGGANGRGTGRGLGGKTSATFPVYPGEEFQVVVGIGGNQLSATGGGGPGGAGLFLYPDINRNFILVQNGRAGGGATWMRRGTFAVPLGGPGRVVVAGGGGGDGGPALVIAGNVGGTQVYAFGPMAPGGHGGAIVAQPGAASAGSSSSGLPISGAGGGGGGSSLQPGAGGIASSDGASTATDGSAGGPISGGGMGGVAGLKGLQAAWPGAGGGGGGGGWQPGGGGGGSFSWDIGGGGGGGGSSFGPPGSAFFQGVQPGDGKLILTFLPNTTALPTVTTATATPSPVQRNATTRLSANVTYKAPATGTVTGLVVFSIDGVDAGPPVSLVNGSAHLDVQANFGTGRHVVTVRFLGSSTVGASGTSVPLDVQ